MAKLLDLVPVLIATNLRGMEQDLEQPFQEGWENMEQEEDLEEKLWDWALEPDLLEDPEAHQQPWACIIDTSSTEY